MAQIVKLRRSSVSGQKPTNTNLQLGELALNTTDGKVYMAKSGSLGPSVEELISTNTVNTGSIHITDNVTASYFTGSFIGDGSQVYNIPLSGVTNLVTISGSIDSRLDTLETLSQSYSGSLYADFIDFNTSSNAPIQSGRLRWNSDEGTLSFGENESGVESFINQQLDYPLVFNDDTVNLVRGTLVMVNPLDVSQGDKLNIIRANSDGTYPSKLIVGVLKEDVAVGETGIAQWFGKLKNVSVPTLESNNVKFSGDTWSEGSILYANPLRLGGLTSVEPTAPNLKVTIAVVTRIVGNNITLLIRPQLNENIEELNNVKTYNISSGDLLMKSGSVWINTKQLDGSYGISGSLDISGSLNIGSGSLDIISPEVLHVGNSGSYNIARFDGYDNNYAQINLKNHHSGSGASGDIVITADNGTENIHYVDLGINSSNYNAGYVGRENDAYLLNAGKDLYVGTIGGSGHPSNLNLFAQNKWETPQIHISGSGKVLFNTLTIAPGYEYEFSGSINANHDLNVEGNISGSNITGSFIGDGSGLYNIPMSGITNLELSKIVSGSVSASISPDNGLQINTDVVIDGTLTAKELYINYVTSSVLYESGSTKFGDTTDDTHQFTGSVYIEGNLNVNSITGSIDFTNLTNTPTLVSGSPQISYTGITDTPSGIVSGSQQLIDLGFVTTGSFESFTSSYTTDSSSFDSRINVITGSIDTFNSVIDSLQLYTSSLDNYTSSLVLNSQTSSMSVLSSSYALTASYALNGGGGGTEGRTAKLDQTTPNTTWTFNHNLGEQYPAITIFDSSDNVVIPSTINAQDGNTLIITFPSPQSGTATATVGGGLPFISSSFDGYVLSVDDNAPTWKGGMVSGSLQITNLGFSTTGSNTFTDDQTIEGTLSISTALVQQTTTTGVTTNTVIAQFPTGSYDSGFFDYVIKDGTNLRAGTITSVWTSSDIVYNEVTTNDLGDTTDVSMIVSLSSGNTNLTANVSSGNWTIKVLSRGL